MRRSRHASAVLLLALLILGCGTKPAPEAPPTPEPTPAAPQPAGAPGIEGTYLIVGIDFMGEKSTDQEIAKESELDRTVKINKDRIQFKLFKRETVRYTLDPSKSPAEIDVLADEPGGKGPKASYGIYKVEGKSLTMFVMGAEEARLRPREFKTVDLLKDGKLNKEAERQPGGFLMLTLKQVSDDTTFVTDPPPPPPPADVDTPLAAALTKKGFVAEKGQYGRYPGVNVTVPGALPPEAVEELNGHPRIRSVAFRSRLGEAPQKVTDEAVRSLNKLDHLVGLEFESCRGITAGAFRDLNRFPALAFVTATDTPLDDAAVAEIAGLKNLEQVHLSGTKLTDTGLASLAKARTLKGVMLGRADVTAAGIKQLNALPDLDLLWLQNMPVADAALGELDLPKLRHLNLARSDISDEGLGKMRALPALETVTLSGLKVTDAGLAQLAKHPRLRDVTLFDTNVTKAGAAELKKLKPKLLISGEK